MLHVVLFGMDPVRSSKMADKLQQLLAKLDGPVRVTQTYGPTTDRNGDSEETVMVIGPPRIVKNGKFIKVLEEACPGVHFEAVSTA